MIAQAQEPGELRADGRAAVKLFNEFDRAFRSRSRPRGAPDPKFPEHESCNYDSRRSTMRRTPARALFFDCEFQLVLALVQMRTWTFTLSSGIGWETTGARVGSRCWSGHLDRRIHAARFFLANLALPEERLTLQTQPPKKAAELSAAARVLPPAVEPARGPFATQWNGETLQATVFDSARRRRRRSPRRSSRSIACCSTTPRGPKAGNFLAFPPDHVVGLFAVPWNDGADDAGRATWETSKTCASSRRRARPKEVGDGAQANADGSWPLRGGRTDHGRRQVQHLRRVRLENGQSGGRVQLLPCIDQVIALEDASDLYRPPASAKGSLSTGVSASPAGGESGSCIRYAPRAAGWASGPGTGDLAIAAGLAAADELPERRVLAVEQACALSGEADHELRRRGVQVAHVGLIEGRAEVVGQAAVSRSMNSPHAEPVAPGIAALHDVRSRSAESATRWNVVPL